VKQLFSIFFVLILWFSTQTIHAAPEVSVDIGRFYYQIGGGKLLPPPGSGIYTFSMHSPIIDFNFAHSCGAFNYHSNITQMVNQFTTHMRQIPGQLMDAFSSAVAGLPNYFMMKTNSSLSNTINKILGDTTELYRLSYKSCAQMEEELRQNPDSNPYQGFIRASIMERWHIGADNNEVISDTHEEVKEDPVNPIVWFGGHRAGTADNPIQVNRDFVIAGYNIMLGRTGDISITTAPTGPAALEPIVRVWANPAEAGQWIQEVIGDHIIVLDNENELVMQSIPGKGLRPKVQALEVEIEAALREVYDHNDYTLINDYLSLPSISGKVADGLRTLPRGESAVMIDQLVSEMAVMEAKERLLQARQMMYTALKHPDLLAIPAAGGAATEILYSRTFPSIRDTTQEIIDELEVRQRTVNPTVLAIIDRAEAARKAGRTTLPAAINKEERVE
jgi:integrating conjugative element protein (TIGR03755 family)